MGVDFYITRAEFFADNDRDPISPEEWLAYVARDPELRLYPVNGPHYVLWSGPSAYEEPWLDWSQGNIITKWPDTALYRKMLSVAGKLGAQIQDDNGTVYSLPTDWEFDPGNHPPSTRASRESWWRRLFSNRT
jgi:hypothetical protein